MRVLLAGLTLLAACGGDDAGAGPDAAPPGVDAGPMDGAWRLTWDCVSGCDSPPVPSLILARTLTVAGPVLTYSNGTDAVHMADRTDTGCLHVDAADEPDRHRADYDLCAVDANLTARIAWTVVGHPTAFVTVSLTATR